MFNCESIGGAAIMEDHKYFTHLIKLHASQAPGDIYWIGKTEVQYNYGKAFRSFEVYGPAEKFASKSTAERHIVQTAKNLIQAISTLGKIRLTHQL
jgi:hypothetical protein